MPTKRDGQQGAGIVSGTTHKEKIPQDRTYMGSKLDNYRPKKPSQKARDGHVIK